MTLHFEDELLAKLDYLNDNLGELQSYLYGIENQMEALVAVLDMALLKNHDDQ